MDDRDRDLLEAILRSARLALSYTEDQGPDWPRDPKTVDAVSKRVEEVGELSKRVGPETLTGITGVDWKGVRAFREVLAHDYGELDVGVLTDIVANKLPDLVVAVEAAVGPTV